MSTSPAIPPANPTESTQAVTESNAALPQPDAAASASPAQPVPAAGTAPAAQALPASPFASSIYGIGTDICDVRRIRASFERHGERFVQRVLSEGEQAVWARRTERWPDRGIRFLATRFSAKEAFSKAIGTGLHWPMQWRWCEIANDTSGKPVIVLHGDLKTWCAERGLRFHITVSDESEYAASFCVAERGPVVVA